MARATVTYAGQLKRFLGSIAELDLDDDHPDRDVAVEKEDDDIGAVLGGLDLGQVDRGEARFGVGRERDAQHLDEDLGGERRAVLEEIDEDLVGHGGHGGDASIRSGRMTIRTRGCHAM